VAHRTPREAKAVYPSDWMRKFYYKPLFTEVHGSNTRLNNDRCTIERKKKEKTREHIARDSG